MPLLTVAGCADHAVIKSCPASALSVKQVGRDAGMGHRTLAYSFTNTSNSPCSLYGFPTVTPLDNSGQVVDSTAVRRVTRSYFSPQREVHSIALSPGQHAWFEIGYSVIPHGDAICPQVKALRLLAPETSRGTEFKQQMWPCDGIEVLPLQAGKPQY